MDRLSCRLALEWELHRKGLVMDCFRPQMALERGLHRKGLVTDCFHPWVALKQEELHTDSAWSKEARPVVLEQRRKDLETMEVVPEVLVH